MSLLCPSILPCSPSPIDVDAIALRKAAGSLKRLTLIHIWLERCALEALAEVFDHRPLEELDLHLLWVNNVSSACSPGIYCYVVWTLKDQFSLIHCVASSYLCCYSLHLSCLSA